MAAPPKARRPRVAAAAPEDTIGAYPGIERSEDDGARGQALSENQSSGSRSNAGPSPDQIRERAYQRYLERGGNHGMDFEDWLEAERELKTGR